jgi:protein SCO1
MKLGLLLPSLLCWGLLACARHESTDTSAGDGPTTLAFAPAATSVARAQASATPSGQVEVASIYDLRVPLLDETGTVRSLDTFRGHPVLITMFYGTCPVACPILTADLKRLERQLPEPVRSNVRVLMVSFDPDRDTPSALAQIKRERGLDAARWTLASAGHEQARELAGVLDIKYRKLENGVFFHSSVIVLLDGQGRPQARIEGADKDASSILEALTRPSI